jgi:polyribonucleotide nucleotidyltransferase
VQDVRTEVKEGDQILVKVVNIDPSGKIRLSRKALIEAPEGAPPSGGSGHEGGREYRGERTEHRAAAGEHRSGRGGRDHGRDRHRPR